MKIKFLLAIPFLAAVTIPAAAGPINVYTGFDPGANSTNPRPNSDSAAANFDATAGVFGSTNIITFETAPLGSFTNLLVAPGITISSGSIRNTPLGTPDSLFGYNTTSGGSRFASMLGGSLTFSFATPTQFFGAYFGGVQLSGTTIVFDDGSVQTLGLPNPGSAGGLLFMGFTDAGASISSITINAGLDFISIDDVRYNGSTVPEPATLAICCVALAGLAALSRHGNR